VSKLIKELKKISNQNVATHSERFFKTAKGEYAEGDKFLGIRVPVLHKIAKKYTALSLKEITRLLASHFHEVRLVALFILVKHYEKANLNTKEEIVNLYLSNIMHINNWDLVDSSAPKILGDFLLDREKDLLYTLATSPNLWERRIAIMATFQFIKNEAFDDTLRLSKLLLNDTEDLIHKSVGWMLREVGKKNINLEKEFLDEHAPKMPRTMLRYAIEKFPPDLRQKYLHSVQ
jgi:3-methyladenine DNA glycosylase AlkD